MLHCEAERSLKQSVYLYKSFNHEYRQGPLYLLSGLLVLCLNKILVSYRRLIDLAIQVQLVYLMEHNAMAQAKEAPRLRGPNDARRGPSFAGDFL